MKAPCAFLLASVLLITPGFADDTAALLTEGQRAYTGGDMETAKRDFQLVLEIDPTNRTATNFLRMIRVNQPADGESKEVEKAYASVRIPSIQLNDATLGATLEYLRQLLERQTGGKLHVNFVVQLPPGTAESEKVTLKLTDVPFTEVLRYVGTLTHVTFSYEKYAVTVKGVEASDQAARRGP